MGGREKGESVFQRYARHGALQEGSWLDRSPSNLESRTFTRFPRTMRNSLISIAAAGLLVACVGRTGPSTTTSPQQPPAGPIAPFNPRAPLTSAQRRWVDETL